MDEVLTQALGSTEAQLWQNYLSAEASGDRKRTLAVLAGFVQALQAGSEEQRRSFAETFCRQMADGGEELPLREPLFASIIGPCLVAAYENGGENAGRWLAYFYPQFRNMPPSRRLIDLPDPPHPMVLLAEAYQRDPDNASTQDALIQYYARQFADALHELPIGVLYGFDGATIAECQKWLSDLALFREVVKKRGVTKKYETAMRYWDFHFRRYADYLTHREQYLDYAKYIDQHWQV